MATSFDLWEKDPFFSAAEEVQESADRMESIYRQWVQEKKLDSNPSSNLSKDLRTALGTAKWQLEELERAVKSNGEEFSVGKSTKARRNQFVLAIENRISIVENSLKESNLSEGESPLSWVRLNEGERDELALFLTGSEEEKEKGSDFQSFDSLKNCAKSASPVNEVLQISASSEDDISRRMLNEQSNFLPPRKLSFSGPKSEHFNAKMNRYWNGLMKWRHGHEYEETIPLQDQQLNRRINACYEGSKSCLGSCGDETCDKQLNGWVGAIQRQLQRSQYQIQYAHPKRMIAWCLLVVLLIAIIMLSSR
ncbi:uncharacterized protein A4U43_C08F12940 [Asparagus officinalis]|uniref:uncharacterized protein LOC109822805 n=1 Tax=Asparagus officinalis TaxID=4686 RepID=UPI00098E7271|nr:uncharacterized protein LOC109822805 [Asparagus officinalis]XP_020244646.1 uncharacterized protein LOC109822805 [Asparagus officinalis]ONK59979.1 uncharacterized protein A4U43_C08F12940 [Asparagus officinalis]